MLHNEGPVIARQSKVDRNEHRAELGYGVVLLEITMGVWRDYGDAGRQAELPAARGPPSPGRRRPRNCSYVRRRAPSTAAGRCPWRRGVRRAKSRGVKGTSIFGEVESPPAAPRVWTGRPWAPHRRQARQRRPTQSRTVAFALAHRAARVPGRYGDSTGQRASVHVGESPCYAEARRPSSRVGATHNS